MQPDVGARFATTSTVATLHECRYSGSTVIIGARATSPWGRERRPLLSRERSSTTSSRTTSNDGASRARRHPPKWALHRFIALGAESWHASPGECPVRWAGTFDEMHVSCSGMWRRIGLPSAPLMPTCCRGPAPRLEVAELLRSPLRGRLPRRLRDEFRPPFCAVLTPNWGDGLRKCKTYPGGTPYPVTLLRRGCRKR